MNPGDHAAVLADWVQALVEELVSAGVNHACLAPGSRSTPLAVTLGGHAMVRTWVHLDERSAGFFALGLARTTGRPAAVVCTSGTAAANFLPAVTEAWHGRVPLLVLTADRPPELRDVGALQTIDQVRLYGSRVKWAVDLPLPEANPTALRHLRITACRAVDLAGRAPAGPVHLNLPFREPLIPGSPGDSAAPRARQLPAVELVGGRLTLTDAEVADLAAEVGACRRGLVVCGPQDDERLPAAVLELASRAGLPVLADPLSQVRRSGRAPRVLVSGYDALLRSPDAACALRPDLVLRLGAAPTSKALAGYLGGLDGVSQVLIDPDDGYRDPTLTATRVVRADPEWLCRAIARALPPVTDAAQRWVEEWRELDGIAAAAVGAALAEDGGSCEPAAVAAAVGAMPAGAAVMLGNSLPLRHADLVMTGDGAPLRCLANRGASGIDGVVSTGLGAAAGGSGPVLLVVGDLSFLHDLGGLLAAHRYDLSATVLVLDNNGGGIFSILPQASQCRDFEELFGTPHDLDLERVAALYGLRMATPGTATEVAEAVRQSVAAGGVNLVLFRADRAATASRLEEIWQRVARAVKARLDHDETHGSPTGQP